MALPTRTILYTLLALVMVDALIEMSFVAATVAFKHRDHPMNVQGPDGTTVILKGKPLGMWVDQGHSSNGAAGTALILVGIVGFLLLTLRNFFQRVIPKLYMPILTTWVVLSILSVMLTIGSFGYAVNLSNSTSGQTLDLSGLASPIRYPYDNWTPQTWYGAILNDLQFVPTDTDEVIIDGASIPWADRGDIERLRHITNGWQWNLIPLFLLQLAVTPFIVLEYLEIRRGRTTAAEQHVEKTEV